MEDHQPTSTDQKAFVRIQHRPAILVQVLAVFGRGFEAVQLGDERDFAKGSRVRH
jgi:hypothetical protein